MVSHLAAIPNEGLDYGLLRYVDRIPELQGGRRTANPVQLSGSPGSRGCHGSPWSLLTGPYIDALPDDPEPDLPLRFALNISVLLVATTRRSATDRELAVEPCAVRGRRH